VDDATRVGATTMPIRANASRRIGCMVGAIVASPAVEMTRGLIANAKAAPGWCDFEKLTG
jgi:hypothetical protein